MGGGKKNNRKKKKQTYVEIASKDAQEFSILDINDVDQVHTER